ncbi:MAG TPA: sulfate adenylyltransferase, partial [Devosiaceae bacterium]|nr:sulfate adenylyltransferase [Devosiaceae bacterium]
PREAVFTALCRKNMGCSHFIVGRDHTGVGDFYGPEETRALFDSLDDLGVQPIFFPAIGYNHDREHYEPLGDAAVAEPISGTQVRAALKNGADIPDWFMRTEIQDLLRGEIEHGRPVFAE